MKTPPLRLAVLLLLAFALWALPPRPAGAQDVVPPPAAEAIPDREYVVGIKEAAPFVIKMSDGSWSGLSIELWKRIADRLHLRYRFVDVSTVQAQLDGVAKGDLDAAIAAITVTAEREKTVDFSQPYYETGLGIAVPAVREANWRPILRAITSFSFIQAVLVLIGVALLVGILIWLFERRHNEDFGGGAAKGLSSSFWWSAVAMTQASTGDFGPRTLPGRILAIVWMVGSIIAIAVFTAGVTSVLTTKELEGIVRGASDLPAARVGNVAGSSSSAYLDGERIRHRGFATPQDGLKAVGAGTIDAFVYDRPLLQWLATQNFAASVEVLDATFATQEYAIALAPGGKLRKPVNIAVLQAVEDDWWRQTLFRYLGEK